jgi:hypothetical protein
VIAEIDKNLTNLEKLKRYELLGSNNPKLRAKMEWGKKRHMELQGGCTYAEFRSVAVTVITVLDLDRVANRTA